MPYACSQCGRAGSSDEPISRAGLCIDCAIRNVQVQNAERRLGDGWQETIGRFGRPHKGCSPVRVTRLRPE